MECFIKALVQAELLRKPQGSMPTCGDGAIAASSTPCTAMPSIRCAPDHVTVSLSAEQLEDLQRPWWARCNRHRGGATQ